tara:strand:- start:242 stop:457 length:216 start_codon:yes stop_codon:yes gene_type:complete
MRFPQLFEHLPVIYNVLRAAGASDEEISFGRITGGWCVIWKVFVCETAGGRIVGGKVSTLKANIHAPTNHF